MSACAKCTQELPAPLDEYGDAAAPLCWTCFSAQLEAAGQPVDGDAEYIDRELEEIDRSISVLEYEIDDLRYERRRLRSQREDIENRKVKAAAEKTQSWLTAVST